MPDPSSSGDITVLLQNWQSGEEAAADELFRMVYAELRKMAGGYMAREQADHTITPTGLVNQACLNLLKDQRLEAQNRGHFFAIVATKMRHFLVDYARRTNAAKRGAGVRAASYEEDMGVVTNAPAKEVLDLNDALERLSGEDELQAKIVELKYFGGYRQAEIADILDIPLKRVRQEWYLAKAWLKQALQAGDESS